MRYTNMLIAGGYLALMALWLYGFRDAGWNAPEALELGVVIAAQPALGLLVGRWWTLILPPAAVLLAVPAGYSNAYPSTEMPVWFGAMFGLVWAIPMVSGGVLVSRFYPDRTRSRSVGLPG